jgi:hypothetical protein
VEVFANNGFIGADASPRDARKGTPVT